MAHLRGPQGCPWDREQTLDSLKPFVLEEAYEVVDAIERGDLEELEGELGDMVFEAVFLAQLCAEAGHFSIADSVQHVVDKLIRRHPHVFGTPEGQTPVDTAAKVVTQWDAIKLEERRRAGRPEPGPLGEIPLAMPALLRALHISKRAAKLRFDWPSMPEVLTKVHEELAELQAALSGGRDADVFEELGDLLFVVVNVARKARLDPEAALRAANQKFMRRFGAMTAHLAKKGLAPATATLADVEASWTAVKARERRRQVPRK